jgi:glutamine amidotransferase PdxT
VFNQFVIDTIRNAEALFIAGGDQSDYVKLWKGTPIEDAIHHVAAKPAPVGGTGAGMAIMGNSFDFSRWRGTGGIAYTLSVEAGALSSSRGEIY